VAVAVATGNRHHSRRRLMGAVVVVGTDSTRSPSDGTQ
jgi:hypothetical protein